MFGKLVQRRMKDVEEFEGRRLKVQEKQNKILEAEKLWLKKKNKKKLSKISKRDSVGIIIF